MFNMSTKWENEEKIVTEAMTKKRWKRYAWMRNKLWNWIKYVQIKFIPFKMLYVNKRNKHKMSKKYEWNVLNFRVYPLHLIFFHDFSMTKTKYSKTCYMWYGMKETCTDAWRDDVADHTLPVWCGVSLNKMTSG